MNALYELAKKVFYLTAPFLLVVFLELVGALPIHMPAFSSVAPPLALIPVYYWAVHAPWRFGMFQAFFSGLLLDILFMLPLGINALIFTLLYYFLNRLRRFIAGKPFYVSWLGFALFGTVALMAEWFLVSLSSRQFIGFAGVLISDVFMIVVYPLIALLCYGLIRLSPEEDYE
ncbi:MAG: rod shape-determining protein MreD [Alphaproteobacteria bacterium]|nr:rod shape-determining protein MreD [Alphaproteobacteria bacterium]